jgi:hypothetical protein
MSPDKLRAIYRLVLVVELVLAVFVILLSTIAIHQQGVICDDDGQRADVPYEMMSSFVLPYAIIVNFLALVAIWVAPKKGRAFMLILFPALMLPNAYDTIAYEVVSVIGADHFCSSPILNMPSLSYICLMLAMMALWVDFRMDDNVWQSSRRYTPVSVNDPTGTHN